MIKIFIVRIIFSRINKINNRLTCVWPFRTLNWYPGFITILISHYEKRINVWSPGIIEVKIVDRIVKITTNGITMTKDSFNKSSNYYLFH